MGREALPRVFEGMRTEIFFLSQLTENFFSLGDWELSPDEEFPDDITNHGAVKKL